MDSIFDNLVSGIVDDFFTNLMFNLKVDRDVSVEVWNSIKELKVAPSVKPVAKPAAKPVVTRKDKMVQYNPEYRYNVEELKILCRCKGYTSSGKKQFLIDQLIGKVDPKFVRVIKGDIGGLKIHKSKIKKKHIAKMYNKTVSNINKLKQGIIKFKVARNKYSNFQHIDSNLIVDMKTNRVIGVQKESAVVELSLEDMDMCRKFNIQFNIPRTIFSEDGMKNREIDEDEELTIDDYDDIKDLANDNDSDDDS